MHSSRFTVVTCENKIPEYFTYAWNMSKLKSRIVYRTDSAEKYVAFTTELYHLTHNTVHMHVVFCILHSYKEIYNCNPLYGWPTLSFFFQNG